MPYAQQNSSRSNEILVPQAGAALEQMKYQIAAEFGVDLGANTSSRENGSVGGEMTKRLVAMAESQWGGRIKQQLH